MRDHQLSIDLNPWYPEGGSLHLPSPASWYEPAHMGQIYWLQSYSFTTSKMLTNSPNANSSGVKKVTKNPEAWISHIMTAGFFGLTEMSEFHGLHRQWSVKVVFWCSCLRFVQVHRGSPVAFSYSRCVRSLPAAADHSQIYPPTLHHERWHPACDTHQWERPNH